MTEPEKIKTAVREAYGDIARRFVEEPVRASCCGPPAETVEASGSDKAQTGSCCAPEAAIEATGVASKFYSAEELADLPESVTDVALGCGNPAAIGELQQGEVVLDLGSGGGIDCFLAARQVGPEGRVIGLDMTPEMIRLARRNAKKVGATNVEFRFGEMEDIPLPDESVDVIISNCVINLSPDKDAVFHEAYRVLRPGGRLSVSDVVVDGQLPQAIRDRLDAWAGCIAGALDESDYLDKMRAAGFDQVEVVSREHATPDEIPEGAEPQLIVVGPDGQAAKCEDVQGWLDEAGVSASELARKVASIKVQARKPA